MSTSKPDFEEYVAACNREMSDLQEEFIKLYDVNSYEHWFYDHGLGAFHFKSDDGRNLYFRYTQVGSFSTETDTWNWSWDNNSTPSHVKRRLEKIKAFGEMYGYERLTTGLIDGDEYTGWEMASIAAKLLSAFGMYRAPSDHLFIYFIFTQELTQEEYEGLGDRFITCGLHGAGTASYVCQHLNKHTYTGFHEAFETDPFIDEKDDYQAWCNECEKVRLKESEWNDVSMDFAKIKAVCDGCYFEIKDKNQTFTKQDFRTKLRNFKNRAFFEIKWTFKKIMLRSYKK